MNRANNQEDAREHARKLGKLHTPGSAAAVSFGCTCQDLLNNNGLGTINIDGEVTWIQNIDCPLHGLGIQKKDVMPKDVWPQVSLAPLPFQRKLQLYLDVGEAVDPFLYAVLQNNLARAFRAGDENELAELPALVDFLYNHMPLFSWGSPDRVISWRKHRGYAGLPKKGNDNA